MVRALLVAPAPILRAGVAAVLRDVPDLALAGVTGDLATARRWTRARPLDALLLAWPAPDPRLLTLLRWVRRHAPQTAALVLVAQCDEGALALLVSAGAAACLSLDQDAAALVRTLRCAARLCRARPDPGDPANGGACPAGCRLPALTGGAPTFGLPAGRAPAEERLDIVVVRTCRPGRHTLHQDVPSAGIHARAACTKRR